MDDGTLFERADPDPDSGPTAVALEIDIADALEIGPLPAVGVSLLRTLARQIDVLAAQLARPHTRPQDRVHLMKLVEVFGGTYERVLAGPSAAVGDPFTDALEAFRASETGDSPASFPPD